MLRAKDVRLFTEDRAEVLKQREKFIEGIKTWFKVQWFMRNLGRAVRRAAFRGETMAELTSSWFSDRETSLFDFRDSKYKWMETAKQKIYDKGYRVTYTTGSHSYYGTVMQVGWGPEEQTPTPAPAPVTPPPPPKPPVPKEVIEKTNRILKKPLAIQLDETDEVKEQVKELVDRLILATMSNMREQPDYQVNYTKGLSFEVSVDLKKITHYSEQEWTEILKTGRRVINLVKRSLMSRYKLEVEMTAVFGYEFRVRLHHVQTVSEMKRAAEDKARDEEIRSIVENHTIGIPDNRSIWTLSHDVNIPEP